jgi:hypothetical protein
MAPVSVERSVDCAADSSDIQISKMNCFVFSAVTKTEIHIFYLIISKGNMPSGR